MSTGFGHPILTSIPATSLPTYDVIDAESIGSSVSKLCRVHTVQLNSLQSSNNKYFFHRYVKRTSCAVRSARSASAVPGEQRGSMCTPVHQYEPARRKTERGSHSRSRSRSHCSLLTRVQLSHCSRSALSLLAFSSPTARVHLSHCSRSALEEY